MGQLFPRGTLREPISGLRRADVVVLTRSDRVADEERVEIQSRIQAIAPDAIWVEMTHQPCELLNASGETTPLTRLAKVPVAAFSGIGNPLGFESTLEACGCRTTAKRTFPDHCAYTAEDIRSLDDWASETDAEAVVCTHKDLVKIGLNELGGKPLWAVVVRMKPMTETDGLERLLETLLQS